MTHLHPLAHQCAQEARSYQKSLLRNDCPLPLYTHLLRTHISLEVRGTGWDILSMGA